MTRQVLPDSHPSVPGPRSLGSRPGQACSGSDPRLSDPRATVLVNGTEVGLRKNINLIPDGSVTIGGVDVPETDTVDITIGATGGGGGGGGAPTGAHYVVTQSNGDLTNEQLLTNTATVEWDFGTPGEAKGSIPSSSISTSLMGGDVTAAGKALLTGADSAAQRLSLGLGDAATLDLGLVAGTVCEGDDDRLSDRRVADGIYETSGPTDMPIGSIADGEYLRRSGDFIVGGTPTGGSGDDTVKAGVSNTDVNMTLVYADLVAQTISIDVGDQIDVQLVGTIQNNSGTTRTYSWQFTVGSMTLVVSDGAAIAASIANRAWFKLNATCSVIATNSTMQTMDLWRTGPVAANTVSSSATTGMRTVWSTQAANLTGASVSVAVSGKTSATGGTSQTMRVHQFKIIKTPTR